MSCNHPLPFDSYCEFVQVVGSGGGGLGRLHFVSARRSEDSLSGIRIDLKAAPLPPAPHKFRGSEIVFTGCWGYN